RSVTPVGPPSRPVGPSAPPNRLNTALRPDWGSPISAIRKTLPPTRRFWRQQKGRRPAPPGLRFQDTVSGRAMKGGSWAGDHPFPCREEFSLRPSKQAAAKDPRRRGRARHPVAAQPDAPPLPLPPGGPDPGGGRAPGGGPEECDLQREIGRAHV